MKSIIIVGAGEGISKAVAIKFGKEGFSVGLVSRNGAKLEKLSEELKELGINTEYLVADASNLVELRKATKELAAALPNLEVLHYNAASLRPLYLLDNDVSEVVKDLHVGLFGAIAVIQELKATLSDNRGTILLTGGGFADYPSAEYGSVSLAKAGIKNLALQLRSPLLEDDISITAISVNGRVDPDDPKHNPTSISNVFWDAYSGKAEAVMHY